MPKNASKRTNDGANVKVESKPNVGPVWDAYRRWGHLEADLDPLGFLQPVKHPELRADTEDAAQARIIYCGTIGAEFMHIPDPARRQWIIDRLESPPATAPDRARILERLVRADLFEQVLQTRYLGTKRFSLEGLSALIPLLDEILSAAAPLGAAEAVIGMSHRGRLNVMNHIVCKDTRDVFAGFEDVDPRSVLGSSDVKYHVGATGKYKTPGGASLGIHLVSNPSHLEAVDPVAMGRARAKQSRRAENGHERVLPITLHGDARIRRAGRSRRSAEPRRPWKATPWAAPCRSS